MGSHMNGVDPRNLTTVGSPNIGKSDLNIPDIESAPEHVYSAPEHIHDVSPARTIQPQPASPALSGAEEEAEPPSASTQDAKPYKCELEMLDGGPCNRGYVRQSALNQHQRRVHIPPTFCPFCSSTKPWHFQGLHKHVKETHPERMWMEFRCPFCSGTHEWDSYHALVTHVGTGHSEIPLQARCAATRGF